MFAREENDINWNFTSPSMPPIPIRPTVRIPVDHEIDGAWAFCKVRKIMVEGSLEAELEVPEARVGNELESAEGVGPPSGMVPPWIDG
jgi:hypothetical protein